jgi:HlyD family secretion protein
MTATLSFQVEDRDNVLKIPNSALRFYPKRDEVREEDKKLLEGVTDPDEEEETTSSITLSAEAKAKANRARSRRHVWVEDGGKLRAIEVIVGINHHEFTELVSGELKEGQKLVTGIEPKT